MSNLTPRLSDVLQDLSRTTGFTFTRTSRDARREAKGLGQALRQEAARGQLLAARLNADALATRVALHNAGLLSKEEELLLQFAPLCDSRVKAIIDAYAINAAGKIAQL